MCRRFDPAPDHFLSPAATRKTNQPDDRRRRSRGRVNQIPISEIVIGGVEAPRETLTSTVRILPTDLRNLDLGGPDSDGGSAITTLAIRVEKGSDPGNSRAGIGSAKQSGPASDPRNNRGRHPIHGIRNPAIRLGDGRRAMSRNAPLRAPKGRFDRVCPRGRIASGSPGRVFVRPRLE